MVSKSDHVGTGAQAPFRVPVGAQWEDYLALDIAGDQTSEVFIDPLHMGSPAKFAKSTKEVTSS